MEIFGYFWQLNIMNKEEIEELKNRVKQNESLRNIHTPYCEKMNGEPDFEVSYTIDPDPEVADIKPKQGLRCDFMYDGDDPKIDGIYMIWPEFLDEDGNIIADKTIDVDPVGKANMWILRPEIRDQIHRGRIKVGTKGFWVAGSMKIARVEVTKIIGLFENE